MQRIPNALCHRKAVIIPMPATVKNGHWKLCSKDLFANHGLETENLGQNETKKSLKEILLVVPHCSKIPDWLWATFTECYVIFPMKISQENFWAQKCYIYTAYLEPNTFNFSTVTGADQSRNVECKQVKLKYISRINLVYLQNWSDGYHTYSWYLNIALSYTLTMG